MRMWKDDNHDVEVLDWGRRGQKGLEGYEPVAGSHRIDYEVSLELFGWPQLECDVQFWSPHDRKDVTALEGMQRKFTGKRTSATKDSESVMDELLCDCLEPVDWSIFKNSAANLNENSTTVTDFISKCGEDCMPKKLIQVLTNWKPQMNQEIHFLFMFRSEVFKSGDHTGNL
eukprot:g43055.t1